MPRPVARAPRAHSGLGLPAPRLRARAVARAFRREAREPQGEVGAPERRRAERRVSPQMAREPAAQQLAARHRASEREQASERERASGSARERAGLRPLAQPGAQVRVEASARLAAQMGLGQELAAARVSVRPVREERARERQALELAKRGV
jgi:hypothetical protein